MGKGRGKIMSEAATSHGQKVGEMDKIEQAT